MTESSSAPIDLRIKRKSDAAEENSVVLKKKKSRTTNNEHETPLDLSTKSPHLQRPFAGIAPASATPFYDPTHLLFNSSALLYDIFLANFNSYCQQQTSSKAESTGPAKSTKASATVASSRAVRDVSTNKQEIYACSCGEKYSSVAHLVSHLKITNHHAQLSSTHDEVAKLVRGQDIWLSRDTNPANQILKCLRCSLSFETLPDLTAHMMKTNHFTQLLPSSSYSSPSQSKSVQQQASGTPNKLFHGSTSTRSACLICSQSFAREVDLVDHIQHFHQIRFNCTTCGMYFENEHLYKEHLLKEMHHRNGKANRNRDYFIHQSKRSRSNQPFSGRISRVHLSVPNGVLRRAQRRKVRPSIDREVEQVLGDLLERLVKLEEGNPTSSAATTAGNALSLLQNFVIKQTPSSTPSQSRQCDMNNNYDDDDENTSEYATKIALERNSAAHVHQRKSIMTKCSKKSDENPLESLEKMLSYPTEALSSAVDEDHRSKSTHASQSFVTMKKKKFDKYRLFAEKMLKSTLS